MQRVLRFIERITGSIGLIAAWLVIPLVIATAYEVASRYLLNAPTVWAFEIGYMVMGSHFLLGAAYTLREGMHVRVDIIYGHVSEKKKACIDLVGYVFLLLPFVIWLTWGLWGYFETSYLNNETSGHSSWNPVVWPYRGVFFVSFLVLTLQIVGEVIKCILVLTGKAETLRSA